MDTWQHPQTYVLRSLNQTLDDLQAKFNRLRPTDPARAQLARMIRQLDDEIDAREGL